MSKLAIRACKHGELEPHALASDVANALVGTERSWPGRVDTMCCGTLASIEFFAKPPRS